MTAGTCKTCRYWDVHSPLQIKGDCRAPDNHRYWHVPVTDQKTGKNSLAMLDSFGGEETDAKHGCNAWQRGQEDEPLYIGANMTAGTPSLNRPLDRSEAEARIERALKVAQEWGAISRRRNADPYVMASDLADGIDQIISILDGKTTKEG